MSLATIRSRQQALNLRLHRALKQWRRHPPETHWLRIVMNESIDARIVSLDPGSKSALEVSGTLRGGAGWRTYRDVQYPDFDLCNPPEVLPEPADVVICEQVLEHVPNPWTAISTLRDLTAPGGELIVSVPFLVKVHGHPSDYWRFTMEGFKQLLASTDLDVEEIHQWGNRRCVRANFGRWAPRRPWHSLENEPDFAVVLWAFCRRPAS